MKETKIAKRIIYPVALALYATLTLIGALNHELWFDEAQAWTIARDNDIFGIIEMMKYEGHPPLWHFILHIFASLGFGCEIMPVISWAFSVMTVSLILFKLKLSPILKLSLAFSSGFLYSNSVISRNYCLIPLILCLIAIVYPERKKHPILLGLLTGILALTHVAFCGIVGAIGIFMLVDLFSDWKSNTKKQNTLNLAGLLVAGVGVLLLVLPLLSSLSHNSITAGNSLDFVTVIRKICQSPFDISADSVILSGEVNPLVTLGAMVVELCMLFLIILLRKRKRAFSMLLINLFVYVIVGHVIFYVNPNRAAIVLFSFVFFISVAMNEQERNTKETELKTDSKLVKSLAQFFSRCKMKNIEIVASVMLIVTIPAGVSYLVRDYGEQFCPVKSAAEYIESELPEDAVFVTSSDFLPQLSAYLPDAKIYSLQHGEFYTYTSHKVVDENIKVSDNAFSDLSQYDNLYMIDVRNTEFEYNPDAVFVLNEGMRYSVNVIAVEIQTFSAEYLETQNESLAL